MAPDEKPPVREEHGYQRTECACAFCQVPCRHIPGALDVADLERLCPPGQDLFAWAKEHLRARTGKPYPTLVPARQANGHCHWHFDGKCAVHEHAPFGCAFFDSHMSQEEVDRRYAASIQARSKDPEDLYHKIWQFLCNLGLIAPAADSDALAKDFQQLERTAQRNMRRLNATSGKPG